MNKNFVFFTAQGDTVAPNGENVENLQILGFEKGRDFNEALEILLKENSWIEENGFDLSEIKYEIIDSNFNKLFC